jgi:hypothetical protein
VRKQSVVVSLGISAVALMSVFAADEKDVALRKPLTVEHAECTFFGPERDKFVDAGKRGSHHGRVIDLTAHALAASELTAAVTSAVPPPPPGTRTGDLIDASTSGTIDRYLFQAMAEQKVAPAPPTTDFEFIRRVTLDLTGHIPTALQILNFVDDTSTDKRSKYIEGLLASSQWVDKWTLYFGDFFQNNSRNTQVVRFADGVQAFNTYIRGSLTSNKPYDQMAREIIAANGTNSYTQGELNWLVGGIVTGGPNQDIYDQQTADIANTFLGIAHLNCLLCHNGKSHLDSLSLWGAQTTRQQAWGMASFLSHTTTPRTTVATNVYYWGASENTAAANYALNTTTGNRPARQPIGTLKNIAPAYLFGGQTASAGKSYRTPLSGYVTADFQFARAAVNYMWAYFFGIGLVDPPNQFDPARQDPDNPPEIPWPTDPTKPWPLQASNPQLLNALAQDFINSKYDLKALMREITTSRAYQLSARYEGTWNPAWTSLFARKLVRRLWSEEVHDAITQATGMTPSYNLGAVYGTVTQALQLPEPLGLPDGNNGAVNNFLNAFLRGNRDDQVRGQDGSISQALDLMNDSFVMNRVQMSKAPKSTLLPSVAAMPNDQAVNQLYLTALSRYPTSAENTSASKNLGPASTRTAELENLLWSLFNKVDFVFNY